MKTKLILAVFLALVLTSFVFAQTNTSGTSSNNSTTSGGNTQSNVSVGGNSSNKVCPVISAPVCKAGEKLQTYDDEEGCMKARCVSQSNVTSGTSTNKQCPIPMPPVDFCKNGTITLEKDSTGCPTLLKCTSKVSSSNTGIASGTSSTSTSSISISQESSGKTSIQSGNAYAVSSSNISIIDSKLTMQTSKGESKEIKIMPDTASEKAISTLQLKQNVTIELKDTGKPVYLIEGKKDVKVLALFKTEMKVTSEVDAETGEITSSNKPWWAFVAKE